MRTAIVALVALILGGFLGWGSTQIEQDQNSDLQQQQLEHMQQLSSYAQELAVLQSRYDALEGQMVVEESTRKSLETALQAAQTDLSEAHDRLAFFDRLLPPGPGGSLGIRALEIEQLGPHLQYRALFMRNAPGAAAFRGTMQFVAEGIQNGRPAKVTLQPATIADTRSSTAPDGQHNPLLLDFEQFQRVDGLLALPEGFIPQTVTLNVLEGKTVRASRPFDLPTEN